MAGGGGTRLWPLSTRTRPKQFLRLSKRSLIQETFARISPLFPFERICVVTVRGQGELISEHLPEIPVKNILEEPLARNTAPCLGFAAIHLKQIDPAAVMVVLPADHYIEEAGRFRQGLTLGMEVAQQGYLVTLGIVPDYPATGYGYIAAGDVLSGSQDDIKAYHVKHFVEKPSLAKAKTFIDEGNYYWNSGIFIWKVERILEEIARHMPELYSGLEEVEASWKCSELNDIIAKVYQKQEAVSIDHGVMEKASRIAVIPVEMGWNDLGDWNSLGAVLEKDADGNVIHAKHIGIDSKDSTVFSLQDKLIATIGLENIVIVDTPEALLVMDRKRAQDIKEIVVKLKMESKAASTSE